MCSVAVALPRSFLCLRSMSEASTKRKELEANEDQLRDETPCFFFPSPRFGFGSNTIKQ